MGAFFRALRSLENLHIPVVDGDGLEVLRQHPNLKVLHLCLLPICLSHHSLWSGFPGWSSIAHRWWWIRLVRRRWRMAIAKVEFTPSEWVRLWPNSQTHKAQTSASIRENALTPAHFLSPWCMNCPSHSVSISRRHRWHNSVAHTRLQKNTACSSILPRTIHQDDTYQPACGYGRQLRVHCPAIQSFWY